MADVEVSGGPQLKARLRAIGDPALSRRILKYWQVRAVQIAKVKAPKRSGNLKRTIGMGPISDTAASIEASAGYAVFVEHGTRPHDIRPVHAKALAWSSNPGAYTLIGTLRAGYSPDHFARVVHHPGTEPHPFLYPAAQAALDEVNTDPVIDAWDSAA